MKVALVNGDYPRREVVARGLSYKLGHARVEAFEYVENVLLSSMDYEVFVVYNNFGHYTSGVQGAQAIRDKAPNALIIGVSATPYADRRFLSAGADDFLLLAGNEITELANIIERNLARRATAAVNGLPSANPRAPALAPSARGSREGGSDKPITNEPRR
ncbi:MAG TPA: response regulator [Anaerolineae bacterium]